MLPSSRWGSNANFPSRCGAALLNLKIPTSCIIIRGRNELQIKFKHTRFIHRRCIKRARIRCLIGIKAQHRRGTIYFKLNHLRLTFIIKNHTRACVSATIPGRPCGQHFIIKDDQISRNTI